MDIRRHNKLKGHSLSLADKIKNANPLAIFDTSIVSDTGLTYSDLQERLDKINSCCSIIELKEEWQETNDGLDQVLKIAAANYCKQPIICPVCADRLQSRRRVIYNEPIKEQARKCEDTITRIENGKFNPQDKDNRYAYLVTYTINDGKSLSNRLEHLKTSRRNWRLMGQKRQDGRSKGEASKIVAGASTIEVKRGSNSGEWHVHAHELMFTSAELDYQVYDQNRRRKLKKRYGDIIPKEELSKIAEHRALFRGEFVPVSKLSREWLQSTGDSISIHCAKLVHVPRKKMEYRRGRLQWVNISEKVRRRLRLMSFADSIAYQSKEALKYFAKPSELEPIDALTVIMDTYNKRMTATYGAFRRLNKENDYNDTTTDADSTYVMIWNKKRSEYGQPIPGKLRDVMHDELEHNTRSMAGKITGNYRRDRRKLVEKRELYGGTLCYALDNLKAMYRSHINETWMAYRQAITAEKIRENANCDNYSSLLSTIGMYRPGSDSRDVYAMVFN